MREFGLELLFFPEYAVRFWFAIEIFMNSLSMTRFHKSVFISSSLVIPAASAL